MRHAAGEQALLRESTGAESETAAASGVAEGAFCAQAFDTGRRRLSENVLNSYYVGLVERTLVI